MTETRLIHGFHAVTAKLRHAADDIREITVAEGRQDGVQGAAGDFGIALAFPVPAAEVRVASGERRLEYRGSERIGLRLT